MKRRVFSGLLGLMITGLLLFFLTIPFLNFLAVLCFVGITSVALKEFYDLTTKAGFFPICTIGIGAGCCYLIMHFLEYVYKLPVHPVAILFISFFILFLKILHEGIPLSLEKFAITVLGICYVIIPLSSIIDMAFLFDRVPKLQGTGAIFLGFFLFSVKSSDMGGYFVGSFLGKHLMAPQISPCKTWEGAVGSMVVGSVVALIGFKGLAVIYPHIHFSFIEKIMISLLFPLLAQCGDLLESLFKRRANVKDSGIIIGLGGILDLLDSLIFTAPMFALFLQWKFSL